MSGASKVGGEGGRQQVAVQPHEPEIRPEIGGAQKNPASQNQTPNYHDSSRRLSKRLGEIRPNLGGGLFGQPIATIQELREAAARSEYFAFEVGQEIIIEDHGSMMRVGRITEITTERICVVDERGRERWLTADELSEELIDNSGKGMKLARSEHKYGNHRYVEIKPKKPVSLRRLQARRTELAPVTEQVKRLLKPLTKSGLIDFATIPAKDFNEFVQYLQTHAGFDGMSFSNPYKALLTDKTYWPLLELLYAERHLDSAVPFSTIEEAEPLLKGFVAELVRIDADRFAQTHIGTQEGRALILSVLRDKENFDLKLRAAVCKAIPGAAETLLEGYESYDIKKEFDFIDEYLDYGNWLVTDKQVASATSGVFKVFERIDEVQGRVEERRKEYLEEAGAAIGVTKRSKELGYGETMEVASRRYEAKDAERIVEIVKETETSRDPVSLLKNRLAHLWLFAADARNWNPNHDSFDHTWEEIEKARAYLLRGTEFFLKNFDQVRSDKDLERLNTKIQEWLNSSINLDGGALKNEFKHQIVGDSIKDFLEGMRSHLRAPLDDLAQVSDEIKYSYEMGESIWFEKVASMLENESLRQGTEQLIEGLVRTKQQLWHGYKQHKALSRAGSQARRWATGGGNITDIQRATAEIDRIIYKLQHAYTADHVEETVKELYEKLKEDGVLYTALDAAEMDGMENLIGLVQTTLEIVIPSLVTGGATGLARLGVAGTRLKKAADAARTVHEARTIGAGGRALRGFGLGAYSSTADNLLELGTGGYREGGETLEKFVKDALATGSAMAVTALARIPKSNHPNIFMKLYERFTSGGLKGFAHTFSADAGMEAVEEVLDQYVRRVLDGNYDALTWGEIREITTICLVGSVPAAIKVGAIAELAGGVTSRPVQNQSGPSSSSAGGSTHGEIEAKAVNATTEPSRTSEMHPVPFTEEEKGALKDAGYSEHQIEPRSPQQTANLLERILRSMILIRGNRRSRLSEEMTTRLIQKLIGAIPGDLPQRVHDLLLYGGFAPDGSRWQRTGRTVQGEAGQNLSHYQLRSEGWDGTQHFDETVSPESGVVVLGRDPADGQGSAMAPVQARIYLDEEGRLHIEDLSKNKQENMTFNSQDPLLGFGTYRLARNESEVPIKKGQMGNREISSVWVEVDPNEPLQEGDVVRLGLDGPIFTLSLESKSPAEVDLSDPEAVGNIRIGPFTVAEWNKRFEQFHAEKASSDVILQRQAIRTPADFLAADHQELDRTSRLPYGWMQYFMQFWVAFRNRTARELGITPGQPFLDLLNQIYAFSAVRSLQIKLERGLPISSQDLARLDRFSRDGIPLPNIRLPESQKISASFRTGQTLPGLGPIPPVAPLSIFAGPMLLWKAYQDGTLGQVAQRIGETVRQFFANAADTLMYAANSGLMSFPAFPTRGSVSPTIASSSNSHHPELARWVTSLLQRATTLGNDSMILRVRGLIFRIASAQEAEIGSIRADLGSLAREIRTEEQNQRLSAGNQTDRGNDSWSHIASIAALEQAGLLDEEAKRLLNHFLSIPGARERIIEFLRNAISFKNGRIRLHQSNLISTYNALRRMLFVFSKIETMSQALGRPLTAQLNQSLPSITYDAMVEVEKGSGREIVWRKKTSTMKNDVPIIDRHLWEVIHSPRRAVGATLQEKNKALKYQKAIEDGHLDAATIEISGTVDREFLRFLHERCPDVEVLYSLTLPDGHEIVFPIEEANPERRSLRRVYPDSELTERERVILRGIQRRLEYGTIGEIFAPDLLTASDIAGSPNEAALRQTIAGDSVDPVQIKDLAVFKEYERLVDQKRLRMLQQTAETELTHRPIHLFHEEVTEEVVDREIRKARAFIENSGNPDYRDQYVVEGETARRVRDEFAYILREVVYEEADRIREEEGNPLIHERRQSKGYRGPAEGYPLDPIHIYMDAIKIITKLDHAVQQRDRSGKADDPLALGRGFRRYDRAHTYPTASDIAQEFQEGRHVQERTTVTVRYPAGIKDDVAVTREFNVTGNPNLERRLLDEIFAENLKNFEAMERDSSQPAAIQRGFQLHRKQLEAAKKRLNDLKERRGQATSSAPASQRREIAAQFESEIQKAKEDLLKCYEGILGQATFDRHVTRVLQRRNDNLRKFAYIVDANGEMRLVEESLDAGGSTDRPSHSMLAGGRNVYGAGEILVRTIKVGDRYVPKAVIINNGSGHYRPASAESLDYVRTLLRENGFDVGEARLEHVRFPQVVVDTPIEELWRNNFFSNHHRPATP